MSKQWVHSNLNPPHWWQLSLSAKPVDILIQRKNNQYHVFIGGIFGSKVAVEPTLAAAQLKAIALTRKSLTQMQRELQPEINWLFWLCLLILIVLGAVWQLFPG